MDCETLLNSCIRPDHKDIQDPFKYLRRNFMQKQLATLV